MSFEEWWTEERYTVFKENCEVSKNLAASILAKDAWQAGFDICKLSQADTKIRANCAILDQACIDCDEDCPAAGSDTH